ncbi:hypothetical protein LCGC14_2837950 [marine sediment metagenome]|uniref:Uncharacterized protein n=1 Tax=marine sediment metagenome TaxID=412755 RepID=A0A0F8YYQ9_9ZZZZ
MTDSEILKPAFSKACEVLANSLNGDNIDDISRIAIQTITGYSRLKATERAGHALKYLVIKDFAGENHGELKAMIQRTLPEYAPQKQLTG